MPRTPSCLAQALAAEQAEDWPFVPEDDGPEADGTQQTHREARLAKIAAARMSGLRIVLEGLEDSGNRAAILRSVDAFGLLHCHEVPSAQPVAGGTANNGGQKWLMLHQHADAATAVAELKEAGFTTYAAVVEGDGAEVVPLEKIDFSQRVALVFGNERLGLTASMRAACDRAFTIRMRGFSESLNVSVAAAVAMHWGRTAREASLGLEAGGGDLPRAELDELVRDYADRSRARGFQRGARQGLSGAGYEGRRRCEREREAYGSLVRAPAAAPAVEAASRDRPVCDRFTQTHRNHFEALSDLQAGASANEG